MAEPDHYTYDLVQRCLALVDDLYGVVAKNVHKQHGGVLTTTFLLTMATPMIILPYERIFKADVEHRVANDKELDPQVTKRIFSDASKTIEDTHFAGLDWRLVHDIMPFNIANGLHSAITDQLAAEPAWDSALAADLKTLWSILRNALAHGGVIYLDEEGKQTDRETKIIAFVSSTGKGPSRRFSILRISESDFFDFLFLWADWLRSERLDRNLVG